MGMLVAQLSGLAVFVVATLMLGALVRRSAQPEAAERLSRVSHLAFWLGLIVPWAAGLAVPGPAALDRLVGLAGLPLALWVRLAFGAPMLIAGVGLMQVSIAGLARKGKGAPAFKLTGAVVASGVYGATRNPMALGYYVACVGGALLSGSSWMVLYTVLGVIPAHAFNLRFFEERELSVRYGESYDDYLRSTPFLVPRFGSRSGASR